MSATAPSPTAPPAGRHQEVLRLENVGVFYNRQGGLFDRKPTRMWALHDVSLTLYKGETLGVIGRNGAGKTSLLKVLTGILKPDRGTMINHGYRAALLSLQVGFVPYLSGRENAILSGLLLGMKRREIDDKMADIVAFAELEELFDEPLGTYSAGMRARLGFSVAVHVDPDVLLIDEVFGVGDADFIRKSRKVMRQKMRSDKTVVLVSHNTREIRQLCDRAVWIHHGKSVCEGPPDEVLRAYQESVRRQRRG
ncbi:MAG: ABC transporter ATP-binding protein [Acidobacteria bacterium]|nr:MAG: ABC transporter ATP-binding protein [Acidobacteriota bacterium]